MGRLTLIFAFCCMLYLLPKEITAFVDVDPDVYRNVSQLITTKGYPVEEHTVQTQDGYLLSMQRIPYGKNNNTQRGDKEVVLLVHGEAGDAKTWVLNPRGLGYFLPDAGYDVWMVNDRGSEYSKSNVYYSTRSIKFWDFTFEDIAKYDIPATIDYVLNATGKESLYLVGFSRGNTVSFILLSEIPEYNKKVKLLAALAPVAFLAHTSSRLPVPVAAAIYLGFEAVTQGEVLHTNTALRVAIYKFCKVQNLGLCETFLFSIAGVGTENKTRLPFQLAQYPSSTSAKIFLHRAQLKRSKKFRYFDYGPVLNKKYYNQLSPPDFQLSQITSPVALFSSANDIRADTKDVAILRSKLKSVVRNYRVPGGAYNHLDIIWGIDVERIINKPLLEVMQKY